MLNRKEIAVMRVIYDVCSKNNDSGIISDDFILESTPEKFKLTSAKVDTILNQLEYDGYFECTKSERKGETVNVITLKQKGKAFKRELIQRRRKLINDMFWRIVFAAMGAVVALIVNKILNSL
ncbi:MAG: hypothetical protein J1G02_01240 [Clostridiales bacterium]|nr:hypothetical protein [Clostridiales bacterium]